MKRSLGILLLVPALFLLMAAFAGSTAAIDAKSAPLRADADENAKRLIEQGRQIFRFDTFGDEAFWTDQLEMQQSVRGLSPQTALALGLKVDAEALPPACDT